MERKGAEVESTNRADHALIVLRRLAGELRERGATKLPPERELAQRLGTSRSTVRRALDELAADGTIRRVKGRAGGAYLAGHRAPSGFESPHGRRLLRDLNTVQGVPEMLHAQGFEEGTRVLSAALTAPTPQVRKALRTAPEEPVISLLRVRYADGDTLSLERMYLRHTAALLRSDLRSIYATLRRDFGVSISTTLEAIELSSTTAATAGLLDQPVSTGLLRLERLGFDQSGTPVEYSIDLFRADRTRLQVRTG